VAFEEILQRLPDLEFAGPVVRVRSNWILGVKSMPVRFKSDRYIDDASASTKRLQPFARFAVVLVYKDGRRLHPVACIANFMQIRQGWGEPCGD
jgi:hypothetical protein